MALLSTVIGGIAVVHYDRWTESPPRDMPPADPEPATSQPKPPSEPDTPVSMPTVPVEDDEDVQTGNSWSLQLDCIGLAPAEGSEFEKFFTYAEHNQGEVVNAFVQLESRFGCECMPIGEGASDNLFPDLEVAGEDAYHDGRLRRICANPSQYRTDKVFAKLDCVAARNFGGLEAGISTFCFPRPLALPIKGYQKEVHGNRGWINGNFVIDAVFAMGGVHVTLYPEGASWQE